MSTGIKRVLVGVLLIGGLTLVIIFLFSKQVSLEDETYPTLSFHVDETLLDTSVSDPNLNIKMSPPKGWLHINSVSLAQINAELNAQLRQGQEHVSLQWIFWQESLGAACCVSSDDKASLDGFVNSWASILKGMYPSAKVLRTAFLKDGLLIYQFMIDTREIVHIKLIFKSDENPVCAVDYLIPKNVYMKELRAIESSIGSIQIVNNE